MSTKKFIKMKKIVMPIWWQILAKDAILLLTKARAFGCS
jgi:hypothetical protein